MHQTLIAVGALAITITFALSTQRAEIKMDKQKVLAETQILAGQIATDMLTHMSIQEFDAATIGTSVNDPDELTPAPFSTGKTFSACDDVDDFHQMRTHTVNAGPGLDFEIDAEVQYVTVDPGTGTVSPSADRTFQKEITVRVRDVPEMRGGTLTHTLPAPIELRQIVAMS